MLAIGGLKEKSMAAYRGGVKTVFIPKENVADLDEVDSVVKDNVKFIPVSNVTEILDYALVECENNEENKISIYNEVLSSSERNTVSQ